MNRLCNLAYVLITAAEAVPLGYLLYLLAPHYHHPNLCPHPSPFHSPPTAGREDKSLERAWASADGNLTAFTAKNGVVVVADNRTKQWAFDFKVNGTVRSLAWTPDSRYLLASGGDSEVYTWDLRASRCRACWNNDGGTPGQRNSTHQM